MLPAVQISRERRERRLAHRRQAILEAAAQIFREAGYEHATLEAIGEAVGLSKASLYYYVRGKEELLGRLLAGVIDEIGRRAGHDLAVDASAEERLRRFLLAHVDVVCRNPTGVLLARHQDIVLGEAHSRAVQAARRRHEQRLEAILEQGFSEGVFRRMDALTMAYLILGALNSAARWHDRLSTKTPEDVAQTLFSIVTDGLRAAVVSPKRRSRRVK